MTAFMPRVSAIVSTYAGMRFFRGCLDDLLAQTLFAANGLEIVIVNSASPEGEDEVARAYAGRYPEQIRYIRTAERETLYAAWNRGIAAARGAYVTNANVDDRHAPEALERMAGVLDADAGAALVYTDSLVTADANVPWGAATVTRRLSWPAYDRDTLFETCYIGQAPMWRRSVHESLGMFDGAMKSAGDYEFWLRMAAAGLRFVHVPEPLCLYLERPDAISLSNIDLNWRESEVARDRYWKADDGVHPKFRKALPHFARLGERVRCYVRGSAFGIYGAGKHTSRMLPLFRQAMEPWGRIAAILDDSPKVSEVGGIPVIRTGDAEGLGLSAVVVSSDTYEAAMAERLRGVLPGQVDVLRVYAAGVAQESLA